MNTKNIGFFCLLFVGCMTSSVCTPDRVFRSHNPEVGKFYTGLHATSVEVIERSLQQKNAAKRVLLMDLINKFNSNKEIVRYANNQLDRLRECERVEREQVAKMRQILAHDDFLYEFEYENNGVQETGLLALNAGRIQYRWVQTTNDY